MTATPWGMGAKATRPKCTHARKTTTKLSSSSYALSRGSERIPVKAFVEHSCPDCGVEWITSQLER